uniref:Sphingomyelin phosphodiesterase n=1 Tax=Panagrellus redivivus TaxID=6233 RepID=A0A7E4W9P3_PANRE
MKLFSSITFLFSILALGITAPVKHELDSTACTACTIVVEMLHDTLGEDVFNNCIGQFVAKVCSALGIEDNFVCKGIVSDFEDTFVYVLDELIVEPRQLCGLLIKECDGGPASLNQTWLIDMPGTKPPYKAPVAPASGKPTLKVLHLSDLHVDNDYLIGSEAKCGEPLCCRPPKDGSEAFTKDVNLPAGKWGTVADCDAPYWLLTDMLAHIAKTHKDVDYIVVSGDLESHADWVYSKEGHIDKVQNISRTIKQYLPGIQAYFAVGNHEGLPIDNFAPHFTPSKFHMDWLYETMATEYADWVPADQMDSVRYNGCFMKKLFPGLRLISLNNALGGDAVNFYLYVNQTDPDGTMTWFLKQLADAEAAGDKVQIVAHIPGNDNEMLEGWAINYYHAVNRFEDTIVAQLFGHTHSEKYYVTYENPDDAKSRPTGVIYSAPSVTPMSNYNPTYRIYTIDGQYEGSSYVHRHFLSLLSPIFDEMITNSTHMGSTKIIIDDFSFGTVQTAMNISYGHVMYNLTELVIIDVFKFVVKYDIKAITEELEDALFFNISAKNFHAVTSFAWKNDRKRLQQKLISLFKKYPQQFTSIPGFNKLGPIVTAELVQAS